MDPFLTIRILPTAALQNIAPRIILWQDDMAATSSAVPHLLNFVPRDAIKRQCCNHAGALTLVTLLLHTIRPPLSALPLPEPAAMERPSQDETQPTFLPDVLPHTVNLSRHRTISSHKIRVKVTNYVRRVKANLRVRSQSGICIGSPRYS